MSTNTQTTKSGLIYQVDSLLRRSYSDLSTEDLHTLMLTILTLKTLAENSSGKVSLESSIVNTLDLESGIQTLLTRLRETANLPCPQEECTTTNLKLVMEKLNGLEQRSLTILSKVSEPTLCQSQELAWRTGLEEWKA